MEVKDYIIQCDNFLPESILNSLYDYCNYCQFEDAKILGTDAHLVNPVVRKTQVRYLHKYRFDMSNAKWYNLLIQFFFKAVDAYQKTLKVDCQIFGFGDIQILKYVEGGHYTWHTDHHFNLPRTLSIIFYVNEDFEGGELSYKLGNNETIYTIKPKKK